MMTFFKRIIFFIATLYLLSFPLFTSASEECLAQVSRPYINLGKTITGFNKKENLFTSQEIDINIECQGEFKGLSIDGYSDSSGKNFLFDDIGAIKLYLTSFYLDKKITQAKLSNVSHGDDVIFSGNKLNVYPGTIISLHNHSIENKSKITMKLIMDFPLVANRTQLKEQKELNAQLIFRIVK